MLNNLNVGAGVKKVSDLEYAPQFGHTSDKKKNTGGLSGWMAWSEDAIALL